MNNYEIGMSILESVGYTETGFNGKDFWIVPTIELSHYDKTAMINHGWYYDGDAWILCDCVSYSTLVFQEWMGEKVVNTYEIVKSYGGIEIARFYEERIERD